MAKYAKKTLDTWLEHLRKGGYKSLTGVKKGLKNLNWPVPDKRRAEKIAILFFKDPKSCPKSFRDPIVDTLDEGPSLAKAAPRAPVDSLLGMRAVVEGELMEELYSPDARIRMQYMSDAVTVNVEIIRGYQVAKLADPLVDISEMQQAVNNLANLNTLMEAELNRGLPLLRSSIQGVRTPSNKGLPQLPVMLSAVEPDLTPKGEVSTGFAGFGKPPTAKEVKAFGDRIPAHLRPPTQ